MTSVNSSKEQQSNQHEQTIQDLTASSHKVFQEALEKQQDMFKGAMFDPFNMASTYMDAMFSLWRNPAKAIEAQQEYMADSLKLWQYTTHRMMGGDETDPVIQPVKGDNRWRSEDWSENLVFDYIKQSYLLASRCVEDTVAGAEDLPDHDARKLSFFTKQLLDALSPTNYAATNPDVLKATLENKGENLVSGLQNFVRDMEQGDGQLKIAMTDPEAFELGVNVATTPGKVVYQNRMLQLIQYSPSTETVNKRPLMIVPPWINKFYILDLQPKNSMIKWLVDQGHTVFVLSWVNPDENYADVEFEHYMSEGLIKAVDAICHITGEDAINAVGYCIGGTLLAATLSYMKKQGDERIKSATFFTALIDFEDSGDLNVFIDESQVGNLEESMADTGYLDGGQMSQAFNMLRSNDLIWSFWINNYLLGKEPMVFDLLYWNSDSTRLPAKMHSFYLRNMYMENRLCKPGGINWAGTDIDVSEIDIPCYFISTKEDHIAPWASTYEGAKLMAGKVRFVLGGSGHIAGIVNPPVKNKYGYWTGPATLPENSDEWFEKARQHEGSWWVDWDKWMKKMSRAQVDARAPGEGPYSALEDAPGSYVMKRL